MIKSVGSPSKASSKSSRDPASASLGVDLPALHAAQARIAAFFRAIEEKRLVRPGETEESIDRAIFELASSEFGVEKYWHRRVVRSGPHTRMLFRELPPDRTIDEDDIVSLDLGVVFSELEADFGRTYVLGNDAEKHRLANDLAVIFRQCQEHYLATPTITGRELFSFVCDAATTRGWTFGGLHAGHLIGQFPFSRETRNNIHNWINPANGWPMRDAFSNGEPRHWILEVHLLDPTGAFGGFYEELLCPLEG